MVLKADFHNHSCLSPCGSLELSPAALVAEAVRKDIKVLALSDHNTALNTPAFEVWCRRLGILALCGLEVTTQEELHCLCLFPTSGAALEFGTFVEGYLLKIRNKPEKWGDQVIVDENDNVVDEVPYWLGTAAELPLSTLGDYCLSAGGLFIPAHIDRPSQSVLSQLGYLPDLPYSALEVRKDPAGLETRGKTLVAGSDAHYLSGVGERTCLVETDSADFEGIQAALHRGSVKI